MAISSETITKIFKLEIKDNEAVNRIVEIEKALKNLESQRKKENKTKKADRDEAWIKRMEQIKQKTSALKKEESALTREIQNQVRQQTHQNGSLNQLRSALNAARARFDDLSESERKNQKIGGALVKQINDLDKQIRKIEESTGRHQRSVGMYGKAMEGLKNVFLRVGVGVLGMAQGMVLLGNKIKEGIETAIRFNREISKLSAITMATAEDIKMLESEAKRLGSTTRYTATQVAELQVELAKLGYGKGDIMVMSESVLRLAQATGSTLADAAALAGAALRIFGEDATQLTKYVDQMATATSKSALSFDYIKTALPIVGGAADMFGFDLQDTLALLGQLANSGMDASMAATATRNIFLKLADSSGVLNQQLGKPVESLEDLLSGLEELRDKGANLNDVLQMTTVRSAVAFTLFMNNTKAARELAESLNYASVSDEKLREEADKLGVSIEDVRKQMEGCKGTAEQMAETMEDNLGGELTRLSSAWDDWMLSLQKGQGPLRWCVEKIRELVGYLGDITRTIAESENQQVSKAMQNYTQGDEYKEKLDADMKAYEEKLKEFIGKGYDLRKAKEKAQLYVIGEINKETNDKLLEESEREEKWLKKTREKYKQWADDSYEELLHRKKHIQDDIKYGSRTLESGLPNVAVYGQVPNISKEELQQELANLNDLIAQWDKYSAAKAKVEAQENRKKAFSTRANRDEDKDGIGVEDDAKRNARLQKEKSAAKALLEAKKAYENAEMKLRKESRKKLIDALNLQYDQEIEMLNYKIEEELKMRGDESAKERADKLAAIEYYNKTIIDKNKERQDELNRLNYEWTQKDYKYTKELYELQIEAMGKGYGDEQKIIRDAYAKRHELLQKEEANEIAALEVLASKNAEIEKQKQERITAIHQKYAKKRNELLVKENDEITDIEIRFSKAREAANAGNPIEALKEKSNQALMEYQKLQDDFASSNMDESEFAQKDAELWQAYLETLDAVQKKRMELALADLEAKKLIKTDDSGNIRINNELEQARMSVEIASSEYEQIRAIGKLSTESQEEFNLRKAQAYYNYIKACENYTGKEIDIMNSLKTATVSSFKDIAEAIANASEENQAAAKMAKVLGLAEVWINNGVAIAQAMSSQTQGDPYTMFARVAAALAQVAAGTISAITSINKAKFAKGAVNIQGPGTSTSDSIDARLSRGESVMTARATQMFGGLLTIMNKVAAQPSVTLPTQYSMYNPAQTAADNNRFADSMRDAVSDIQVVASIEEINRVGERVNNIKVLDNI